MSETSLAKYLRERGLGSAATRDLEVSELYDPEVVAQAEAEATERGASGPEEQDIIQFYNPFQGMFQGPDAERPDPTFIPGVRFPKLGTLATQDFGNFLTIPANITEERIRLGGDLFEINRGEWRPTDKDVLDAITKHGLRGDDRTIGKLLNSTSQEDLEAQALVYKRREVREDQIAVDNPGLIGLGVRMGWNMFDPTFLVPGVGAAQALTVKIANSSTKTGAAIRFASDGLSKAERFRIGAITAAAVDAPIETLNTMADPQRDILMTAAFLAVSPVLGGALNSLGRTKADEIVKAVNYLDNTLADNIRKGVDGGAGGAAQAGPVPFRDFDEQLPGAPSRAGKLTFGTPLNFLARSSNAAARLLADKLSWNPATRSVQSQTAAEAQKRVYESRAMYLREGRMAAKEYFGSRGFQPSTEQLDDFFRQVGMHLQGVLPSEDPHILRAADAFREGFADTLAYVRDRDYVTGRDRPPPVRDPETTPGDPSAPPQGEPQVNPETAPAAAPTTTEGGNPYFGRKSFRGVDSQAAEGEPPVQTSSRVNDIIASEDARFELARHYDEVLASAEFTGRYKKPLGAASSAAVAAGLAGTGATVGAWLADADAETVAGAGLLAAALGSVLGAAVGKGRLRSWENKTPGVAIFLGPNSPGVDKKALAKAREMEAAGKDRDTIWKETGWGRFADGSWITEIDEPLGRLVDDLFDDPRVLPEVLKGTRFFEAEPELRKTIVQVRELLDFLKANPNTDGVAIAAARRMAVSTNLRPADQLRVVLHELNHIAQDVRGTQFAGRTEFDARAREASRKLDEIHEEIVELGMSDSPDADRLTVLMTQYDEVLDQVQGGVHYQYATLAAEAESRLVETRMGLSREQRRARPPWKDYDVPEGDLWSGKTAAMAASLGSDLRRFRDPSWFDQNVKAGTFEEGELAGYQYWRSEEAGVTTWVEDLGDGEATFNWDWNRNIDNDTVFADNPDAGPAQSARAFAFAQASFERMAAEGKFEVITFEGLKKPTKEGQAASGHERVQEFLMARSNTPGYVASKGTWKTKIKDPETGELIEVTRSSFAFSKVGKGLDEVWEGIRRGKVDIEVIEPAGKQPVMASRKADRGGRYEDPKADAGKPGDDYRGLEEWRYVTEDPAYLPRRFNKAGWDRVFLSPTFRGNLNRLGNRIGDAIYRANANELDARAAAMARPISGEELAWRIGRQYAKTVSKLMNPAQKGKNPYRRVSPDDREAAKEVVRDALADGNEMGMETEEAMELILDLIAPVRKQGAESPRARPRIEMKLDAELDADFIDMFEWNVENLFVDYARNLSGYAGLLRAGFRSEAEVRTLIDKVRNASDRDPKYQRRAEREAEMLENLVDAIIGRPQEDLMANKHWSWTANQLRRLNYGALMNNTGFLAISELGGAITQVGLFRTFGMIPELMKYYRQVRRGDPEVSQNLFYLADAVMGHGSAQVRARVGQMSRFDMADGSVTDRGLQNSGAIDRFTRKQANLVGRFSGMAPMQEWLRMTIVTAEAQDWVKAARKGSPLYSARRMAALGVDADMWRRISTQLRKWGDETSPDTHQKVPNMDLSRWDDGEALNVWLNALDRNARRLVLEGDVGHQAFWLRNRPSAQLLFQFLNFPINAFSKHVGFALNTRDGRAGVETLMMALGGGIGYMARVHAQAAAMDTQEERDAFLEERFTAGEFGKAAFYYSAHASLLPNAVDGALGLAQRAGAPVEPVFSKTRSTGLPGDPLTGNPSYSRINGGLNKIKNLSEGTPFSEQDVQSVIQHFAPLGNHIAMSAVLDRLLEFLPDEEGSAEDQAQR